MRMVPKTWKAQWNFIHAKNYCWRQFWFAITHQIFVHEYNKTLHDLWSDNLEYNYINICLHLVWKYLVNKPLLTTCLLADYVYVWEIVQKKNIWPRSEAFRANVNTGYFCILITVSTNYFIDYKNISSGTLYKHYLEVRLCQTTGCIIHKSILSRL